MDNGKKANMELLLEIGIAAGKTSLPTGFQVLIIWLYSNHHAIPAMIQDI